MLDMNNLNPGHQHVNSQDINLNYRDIKPPKSANNIYRPSKIIPESNNNNNMNMQQNNFQGYVNDSGANNLPKINKQNINMRKSNLNLSSENMDLDNVYNDEQYQDETQPRV